MQISEITGEIVVEPAFTFIAQEKRLFMCRSVIADFLEESDEKKGLNLHVLICFGNTAQYIAKNCRKNQRVKVKGKFLNYNYTDYNGTKHYTEFLLVTDVQILTEVKVERAEMLNMLRDKYELPETDAYALHYLKEHGYSIIDESVFCRFEEVRQCYRLI